MISARFESRGVLVISQPPMIRHDTRLTEAAKPAAQTIRSLIRMTRVRRPERTLPVPRTTSVLLVLTKAAEGRCLVALKLNYQAVVRQLDSVG